MSEVTHRLATKESIESLISAIEAHSTAVTGSVDAQTTAIEALPNATQEAADNANAAAESATTAAASIAGMVAKTFSASSKYYVGDYVYYDGGLYRFIADHDAGAWDAGDVVSVSLGDEVDDVKDAFFGFRKNVSDVALMDILYPFTAGYGINSSGVLFSSGNGAKRISTEQFIDITTASQIYYNVVSGYRVYIAFYSAMTDTSYVATSDWLTGNSFINKTGSTWNYMRICYASVGDESVLTVADANKARVSIDYPLYINVKECLTRRDRPSYNLNDYIEYGVYPLGSSTQYTSTPALPDSFGNAGSLLVIPGYGTDVSYGIYRNRVVQVLISDSGSYNMWIRHCTNSDRTTFTMWNPIREHEVACGWDASTFEVGGISESGDNNSNTKRIRTQGYIDVRQYKSIHYSITNGYRAWFYAYSSTSASSMLACTDWAVKDGEFILPEGTAYIRACYQSVGDAQTLTTSYYNVVAVSFGFASLDIFPQINDKTRWIAIGDSLTYGVYSTDSNTNANAKYVSWANRLSNSLGYELTKMASRGIGFIKKGHDPLDGSLMIDFSTLLDRVVALEGNSYNLITVAVGINDYNNINDDNGDPITIERIRAAVGTTITTLATRFPNARLVFVTPFNACNHGDASGLYDYGYEYGGRTLKDVADAIKEVCDSYGVECLYLSTNFIFNTVNITTLQPDGVHPSYYGHTLIAKAMAHSLLN